MKILIPSDWKEVDILKTTDPNEFGESLRAYLFVGNINDTGCYTTFNVIPMMKQVKGGKIFEEAKKHLYDDIEPTVYHYKIKEKDCWMRFDDPEGKPDKMRMCDPTEIVMGYTWEQDGCLYIRYNNRVAINNDAKCCYDWQWLEERNNND